MLKAALENLLESASYYMDMIRATVSSETRVCFELADTGESATLIFGKEVYAEDGCSSPDLKMSFDSSLLRDALEGRADLYSLAARASRLERRPVETRFLNRGRLDELLELCDAVRMYLFLPGKIKLRHMGCQLAGEAHGGHPVSLVNWNGMRCSYILLYKGDVLNEEGERDPWPQLFIVLTGEGSARIGDEKLQVLPGMAIYIPRNAIHQLEPLNENLELIWIAWNAPETKPPRKSCSSAWCPFHGKTRVIGPWFAGSVKSLDEEGFAEIMCSELQYVYEAKKYKELEKKVTAYAPPCVGPELGESVVICGTLTDKETPPYVVVARASPQTG